MRKVTSHPGMEEELVRAAIYYERQCEGLGDRFVDEYEQAVDRIVSRPEAWPPLGECFRRHQLRHFPYGVIYRVLPEEVRILALMHLHRHPDYWKDRL